MDEHANDDLGVVVMVVVVEEDVGADDDDNVGTEWACFGDAGDDDNDTAGEPDETVTMSHCTNMDST